jgi:hypothetical protein
VNALRAKRRKVGRTARSKPSVRLRIYNRGFPQLFHSEVGMNVGPSHAGGSPPSPDPELPGEFVSDDLRDDCARFLDELRQLVELRRQPTPDNAAWAPGPLE